MESVNVLKYKYLLAEFKSTKDPKVAIEICDMFIDGSLKATASVKDNKLLFIIASRYRSRCIRCGEAYEFGDSIFVQNKKAWHASCAHGDELKLPYFLDSVEKGLIDGIEKKG